MKFDMHVHSSHSADGHAAPRQILKQARRLGLDGLCIADHNTIAGSIEARKIAPEFKLVIVGGMEISSSAGHILAYGISEAIPRDLDPAETRDRIHSQGGMAVVPHPYRFWSGLGDGATLMVKPDAVETVNAHSTARENMLAGKLARRMGLPGTAGSDSHELASIGRAFTIVSDASSEEDVLRAIKAGRTKARGQSRKTTTALKDRTVSVAMWVGRGFKKM